jgi:hypothetical protein
MVTRRMQAVLRDCRTELGSKIYLFRIYTTSI